jgi:hypothetical protein
MVDMFRAFVFRAALLSGDFNDAGGVGHHILLETLL